jgi:hypothetical protein
MAAPIPSEPEFEHFCPAPTTEITLKLPEAEFSKTKMPLSLNTCEYVLTVMF